MEPNVFEYNRKVGKPVFDLIIGCNSMEKLGIVMDFKAKSITIDEIILPMRNFENLTNKSKVKEAWAISNALAYEPISTEQATQRAMKILDASYKKADLQAAVDNCIHLNSVEKDKLLETYSRNLSSSLTEPWDTGEPSLSPFNQWKG